MSPCTFLNNTHSLSDENYFLNFKSLCIWGFGKNNNGKTKPNVVFFQNLLSVCIQSYRQMNEIMHM